MKVDFDKKTFQFYGLNSLSNNSKLEIDLKTYKEIKEAKSINYQIIKNMLIDVNPKLPMRNKQITKDFYLNKLNFKVFGSTDYDGYLMVQKDAIQIHFFEFKELDPKENYGQIYIRTNDIEGLYQSFLDTKTSIHPNGLLELKPWGQKEFSVLDPDHNLLTFGEST